MSEIKLLIVEDEKSVIEAWADSIDLFNSENKTNGVELKPDFLSKFSESEKKISNLYDAAIIDLRLEEDKDNTKDECSGARLVKEKIKALRVPTFVYTALPESLEDFNENESVFFKKYTKAEGFSNMEKILQEIKDIFDTGITRILGGRGKIEILLDTIFWTHLDPSFEYWMKPGNLREKDSVTREAILLRYISIYLSEYLAFNQTDRLDDYTSAEVYLIPPIGKTFITGDILKKKDDLTLYLILTPACDMVLRDGSQRNADSILLLGLSEWNKNKAFNGITPSSMKKKEQQLREYINNKKARYHYLPPYNTFKGMFIDFESVKSFEFATLENDYERLATISPLFLRNIIARFSQFYSRQGQPDFDTNDQLNQLLRQDKSDA